MLRLQMLMNLQIFNPEHHLKCKRPDLTHEETQQIRLYLEFIQVIKVNQNAQAARE